MRDAVRLFLPLLLAFVVGGLVLVLLGKNPLTYYLYVFQRSIFSWGGLQETLTRMAPLLLIAAGLIVAFRAGIWNLGGDGQYLLAATVTAALAPVLNETLPQPLLFITCFVIAMIVAALWSLLPAFLKARYGTNEIITSLMMSFIGISFANIMVKLFFWDPQTTVPQTQTLDVVDRLPRLGDSNIHLGLLIALLIVILVHILMTRTAFGLKLKVVGANPAAARHAGLNMTLLTFVTFALSAGLIGLAGAVDILGVWGNVRADWNPAYGMLVVPLVFLGRLNGIAVIGFVLFFSALMIGGESAARRLGVPQDFVLFLMGLILAFLGLVEYLAHRRDLRIVI